MNSIDLSLIDNCDHTRREAAKQLDDGIGDTFVSGDTGRSALFDCPGKGRRR